MAEPLDYRNAQSPQLPEPALPLAPRAAIPVEFDSIVTRTTDLAAARAIEDQLARDEVEIFRAEDGEGAGASVVLLARAQDLEKAKGVAEAIFARRRKLRSFGR